MTKCFRYLMRSYLPNFIMAAIFGLVILGGCLITGSYKNGDGLFAGYFSMFPALLHLTGMLGGAAIATSCLNTALSYGALRRDYFRGILLFLLVQTLIFWGLEAALAAIPGLLGWTMIPLVSRRLSLFFPLILAALTAFGGAIGELYLRGRLFHRLVTLLAIFFVMMSAPLVSAVESRPELWGVLPVVIPLFFGAVLALSLLWLRKTVLAFQVR